MAKLIRQASESVDIRGLLDIDTPSGEPLSGIYKKSFAYFTIKDRLPVILTKIVDSLSRDKDEIAQKYGNDAKEDVKSIIGCVSKLKNELMTNKPLVELKNVPGCCLDDVDEWNKMLKERTEIEGETPTWFKTIWLYCECYMYRRLYQEILTTKHLTNYDVFEKQKQDAFKNSLTSINTLSQYAINLMNEKFRNSSNIDVKTELIKLVKLDLWGNRCDLSLSAGADASQSGDPIKMLESLEQDLLVDNTNTIWDTINSSVTNVIDIVLDNAGYELFTDLCLAAFLTTFKLTDKVRFYVKAIPWYVSDVTMQDFMWIIEAMQNTNNEHVKALSQMCQTYLKNGRWSVEVEQFWTEPYTYAQMKDKDPKLYKKLSEAKLIIFKGDLNYRKLLGDINWDHTTSLVEALQGFHPTNVVSLRTLKCDIIVGLSPGQDMKVQEDDPNWLISGRFGIIQFA